MNQVRARPQTEEPKQFDKGRRLPHIEGWNKGRKRCPQRKIKQQRGGAFFHHHFLGQHIEHGKQKGCAHGQQRHHFKRQGPWLDYDQNPNKSTDTCNPSIKRDFFLQQQQRNGHEKEGLGKRKNRNFRQRQVNQAKNEQRNGRRANHRPPHVQISPFCFKGLPSLRNHERQHGDHTKEKTEKRNLHPIQPRPHKLGDHVIRNADERCKNGPENPLPVSRGQEPI